MSTRLRKFIGMIFFLITLFLSIIIAVQVENIMPVNSNIYLQMLVYTVIGILCVVPAGGVIWWMSKPGK
ncbi:MAG: DUF2842 domain-containing protein [Methyloligellaceae bacterium]